MKQTKKQLEKRRDEIDAQLNKVNQKERINLDTDMEEQAIQVEQQEVSTTTEENLQKELTDIEEKLSAMDEK
ncbi:MAG: hypothetical protein ACR2N3_04135 [Pyrinomonadaceae bacterium]